MKAIAKKASKVTRCHGEENSFALYQSLHNRKSQVEQFSSKMEGEGGVKSLSMVRIVMMAAAIASGRLFTPVAADSSFYLLL